jgi:hypothetical protein
MILADLIWIPVATLLAYTIPACYYDLKHREMPEGFWNLMIILGIPFTGLLYLTGYYPLYLGLLAGFAVFVYAALLAKDVYQGADFAYLTWITLFLVQNPVTGHILMPISFGIYLIASVVSFGILYQTKIVKDLLYSHNLPGFPMMLPISLALWLTVWLA